MQWFTAGLVVTGTLVLIAGGFLHSHGWLVVGAIILFGGLVLLPDGD